MTRDVTPRYESEVLTIGDCTLVEGGASALRENGDMKLYSATIFNVSLLSLGN